MYVIIPLIILGITFLIIGSIINSKERKISENQEEINEKAKEFLKQSNFIESKIFYINDYTTFDDENYCKQFISLDESNKKICLIDYNKANIIIVEFNEFLNYELYENGNHINTGAVVGGWSSLFVGNTTGMCQELKLIIRLRKYNNSQVVYNIIHDTALNIGISKSSQAYKKCIESVQEVISFFEIVKEENSKITNKDDTKKTTN